MSDSPTDRDLLEQIGRGERDALDALLTQHRERLRRMIALRLDRRVQGRIDPSDVIQEAYVEACRRIDEFRRDPSVPFFVWLRFLTGQKLAHIHRKELGVQARDAARDVSINRGPLPEATSAALAAQLVGKLTAPSQAAMRAEMKIRLQDALNQMEPVDREVLALRHFEQLSNSETALILGLSEPGACNRYVRALERLKKVLAAMPGGLPEMEL